VEFRPHDYQKRAINFILEHPASGLFLEMGLGKTVITLTAIDELMNDRFEVQKCLVIAPLRVAEDTWSRESTKWDHLKHLRIAKILGSAADRIRALKKNADIYVINRENVVWLVEYLEENRIRWPFDMVVIDELSSFKNNQAKRFKALRKMRPMMDRIVGLTGTPAANSLMDLWAEMYLLDRGERLGRTLTAYRGNWFRPGYGNGYVTYKWEPRRGALEDITKRIADITVSMKAEDYLELPDKIENTIEVDMGENGTKLYQDMERESLIELEGADEIVALDAAAVMSKLLQMANGFIYDQAHNSIHLHEAKLEALEEIVEAADAPVLVFYNFQADKDAILAKFHEARLLENDSTIEDWNRGKIKMLLAHPASAGYGLNLQEGGHIMAWYGLPWSLEQYLQAVARLQRQGQKYPVMVYHIIAKGTVDEQVMKSLQKKDITQSALIGILKDRKQGYK
jgi:SNF2 family DNA or RNA helicase